MPEGDTVWLVAERLRAALQGRRIERAVSRHPSVDEQALMGRMVESIETRGKHLLMHLDAGGTLHVGFGLHCRWRVSPEPMVGGALLTLGVGDTTATCSKPRTLGLVRTVALERYAPVATLGPDLLSEDFDAAALADGWASRADVEVGPALLDQRLACGIGNVYKSEVCYLRRVDPFARLGSLTEDQRVGLWTEAATWMRRNLDGRPRRTRNALGRSKDQRLWVYKRARRPCHRCGTVIRKREQGAERRSTYFCPACQPVS